KLITDVKVELPASTPAILLKGNAVVNTKRADRQVQTQTETEVRGNVACAEIVSVGVDKTSVVEKGPARFLDDWERPFDGGASEGLTAQWLTIGISRTNVAKFEAAQIVRAA